MLNKVILVGRLTDNPELRQTAVGSTVTKFTIAINKKYKKDGKETADFIRCEAWGKTAEFITKYFAKGQIIITEGSLRNNDYTDRNGTKHYSFVVVVDSVNFGNSKKENSNESAVDPVINYDDIDLSEFESLDDGEVPF